MKSFHRCLWLLFLLFASSVWADEGQPPGEVPTGTWRLDYDFQGNAIHDEIRLQLGEGEKVTGKLFRNEREPVDITDGTFRDGVVAFTIRGNANGTDWKTVYRGKVKGDDIENGTVLLTFNDESYEFPWRPKRIVEMDDLVGVWKLRVPSPDGTVFEPTLRVLANGETYESEYTSSRADDIEVEELVVRDNEMRLTISVDYEGQELVVNYRGRPYGDSISGSFAYEYGDASGEGKFIAKRQPARPVDREGPQTNPSDHSSSDRPR